MWLLCVCVFLAAIPGSSGCSANCCCRPTSPVSMNLCSFKTEERAWNQQHRHQWFREWRTLHVWKSPGGTPNCVQADCMGHLGGGAGLQLQGEVRSGGIIGYQGNQRRTCPSLPLWSVIRRRCSDLKLEGSSIGTWGKHVGKSAFE